MHSNFYRDSKGDEYTVLHDDYEGVVKIVGPSPAMDAILSHQDHTITVRVPSEILEQYVLDKLREAKIGRLEDCVGDDLKRELGLL